MRAVILAGGRGTRLAEETVSRPKPMVEVGGRPLLWHICKIYAAHGVTDFIVCCGYKGYIIKEFFANYFLHMSDVSFDLRENRMEVHQTAAEPWRITLVDTGLDTQTGGRLKRIADYVADDDDFCCTYGDGVADVDITALVEFHRRQGRLATVTAVQPPGRFGALDIEGDRVTAFLEKPHGDGNWINGGFFVLSPEVLKAIPGDGTLFEQGPLGELAATGQLSVFRHRGFFQPVDTLRELQQLEELWQSDEAPWKVW
ncbi:MAG TPA: glucose-1-phosphate cytidylyltransferase [Acidimicrobiales bacterium]|nr:glucose-1-phosphate cytidylyltransferase [Acidimicrobiales bacterium]